MKEAIELLKKTQDQRPPSIQLDDLREEILSSIRQRRLQEGFSLKTLWIAAVPVLACVGIAAVMWLQFTDPLNELMSQFMVVMR